MLLFTFLTTVLLNLKNDHSENDAQHVDGILRAVGDTANCSESQLLVHPGFEVGSRKTIAFGFIAIAFIKSSSDRARITVYTGV